MAAPPNKEADTKRALQETEQQGAAQQAARQQAAEQAARAAAEAYRLAQERVEAAAALRNVEMTTETIASKIDALAERQRAAEARVQEHAKALQPLLPLMERLSLYPEETILAVPGSPESALRGALVLQALSRQIEVETEALRHDQAEAQAAADALRQQYPALRDAEAAQKQRSDALDDAIAKAHNDQAAAESLAADAAAKAADAAKRRDSLRAALAALEAQRRADEARAKADAERDEKNRKQAEAEMARERESVAASPTGPGTIPAAAGAHGQLQPPVIGVVVKAWGDQTDAGPSTGLSYYAPPGARVISPCGGRVVFAEPFRSYGLLLIVDCGGGYHVVLAGFERLDVKLGQKLVSGEPVGVMPSWEPGSTGRRPALYVELRHEGTPVNPAPWLKASS